MAGKTAIALSEPSVTVVLGKCQQTEGEKKEERWRREAPACWATFNYFRSHQTENCPPWQISPAQRACTQSRVAVRTFICRAPFIQKKALHNSKHHHSDRQKHIVHIHASPCRAGVPWAGTARGICLTVCAAALHNFPGKREGRGGLVVP